MGEWRIGPSHLTIQPRRAVHAVPVALSAGALVLTLQPGGRMSW